MANYNKVEIGKLNEIRDRIQDDLLKRLDEFKQVWNRFDKHEIFCEFVFCLLTPQSKARSCQIALDGLIEKGLLENGKQEEIAEDINIVRFRNNKAKYIVEARERYHHVEESNLRDILHSISDPFDMREWLVKSIKGMGMKEASHFLRNIGFGYDLSILDRHILKNLVRLNVIGEIPKSLSSKKYIEIEEKMRIFAKAISIPMDQLDLVLWYKEAGEIFK